MTQDAATSVANNPHREIWHTIFAVGHPDLQKYQRFNMRLPSPPRCKLCYAPFHGIGSLLMKFQGRAPSNKNPRYCSRCDQFLRKFPGGAEVETTIMFIDVRGSTGLAETMTPMEFSGVMHNFYVQTFPVLNGTDGFILDVRGDGLLALYPPGFSGADHARKALRAVDELLGLEIPGPNSSRIRFGVGVHTGIAYIGTMTGAESGVEDVTVLGDAANVAARLCSASQPGEALVSDATCSASGLDVSRQIQRSVEMKGKSAPMNVRVFKQSGEAKSG
jgi:adenylate cyclase